MSLIFKIIGTHSQGNSIEDEGLQENTEGHGPYIQQACKEWNKEATAG